MNRGMKFYFKNSVRSTTKTLKKKGNLLRFWIWQFMALLALGLPPLLPITNVMGHRIAKQTRDNKNIYLSDSISAFDKPKAYFTLVGAYMFKFLAFLAILLVFSGVGGLFYLLGGIVGGFVNDMTIGYYFALPASIALVVFLVFLPFIQVPVAFIIDDENEMGISRVIYNSMDPLKKEGKHIILLSYLLEFGLLYAYLGLGYLCALLVIQAQFEGFIAILCLVMLVFTAGLVYLAPLFILVGKTIRVSLYEDVVMDRFNLNKRISGVTVKTAQVKEKPSKENELVDLFDKEDAKDIVYALPEDKTAKRVAYEIDENNIIRFVHKEETVDEAMDKIPEADPEIVEEMKKYTGPIEDSDFDSIPEADPELVEAIEEIQSMEENKTVEEPVVEEAPVEEPVVEETPVEEPVVEETPETPVEEPIVEEIFEEAPEAPIEEPVLEEAPEEMVAEPILEETPVEDIPEEPIVEETPVEEPVAEEAPVEEPVIEDIPEEPIVEEEPVEEPTLEDIPEEPVEEDDEFAAFLDSVPEKKEEEDDEFAAYMNGLEDKSENDDEYDEFEDNLLKESEKLDKEIEELNALMHKKDEVEEEEEPEPQEEEEDEFMASAPVIDFEEARKKKARNAKAQEEPEEKPEVVEEVAPAPKKRGRKKKTEGVGE